MKKGETGMVDQTHNKQNGIRFTKHIEDDAT